MSVTVYGSSDDLIEVEGDLNEEFSLVDHHDEGDLLGFSEGTVLRITYPPSGVWRITLVHQGRAHVQVTQAPEDNDANYSDRAELVLADYDTVTPIAWVLHGTAWAHA